MRVVECLMAVGDESIRDALFEEMKGDILGKNRFIDSCAFSVHMFVNEGGMVN